MFESSHLFAIMPDNENVDPKKSQPKERAAGSPSQKNSSTNARDVSASQLRGGSQNDDGSRDSSPPAKKKRRLSSDSHSIVDIQIPDADLISPFQITDGQKLVASSRKITKPPIRPSYIEGLKAIESEQLPQDLQDGLQLDHSREYMERKFREWQQQQAENAIDSDTLQQISEYGLDDTGGSFSSIPTDVVAKPDREQFPWQGREFTQLSKCSQASSKAWKNAYQAYPKLKATLPYKEAVVLMKALVLNELQYYRGKNLKRDEAAARRHVPNTSLEPLGFAQLAPKTVHDLEKGLSGGKQVRPEATELVSFLSAKGYSGEGHEATALLDPDCVPMLVGAKIESLIDYYERALDKFSAKPLRIDSRTLAYGYKPDVFYNPKDPGDPNFHPVESAEQALSERLRGYDLLFPCTQENVLTKSKHLKNVENWLTRLNEPT